MRRLTNVSIYGEVPIPIRPLRIIGVIAIIAILYFGLKSGDLIPVTDMPIIPLTIAITSLVLGLLLFLLSLSWRSELLLIFGIALIVSCFIIVLHYG